MSRIYTSPSRAFTLVELLVVIALVSVLLSFLLPSLSSARRKAQQIQCLSNERTYAFTFASYNNDHKGQYPYIFEAQTPLSTGSFLVFGSAGVVWMQGLSGYYPGSVAYTVANAGVSNPIVAKRLRCPANPWYATSVGGSWTGVTYGMNGVPGSQTPFPYSYGSNNGTPANDPFLDRSRYFKQARHDNLRKPSSLCLIADASNLYGSEFPWLPLGVTVTDHYLDNTAFTLGSTSYNQWKTRISTFGPSAIDFAAGARVNHEHGWNVLHADGSARYYSKNRMETMGLNTANSTPHAAFWYDR